MRAIAALTAVMLLLVACGTGDEPDGSEPSVSDSQAAGVTVSGGPQDKPDIDIPAGDPPAGLTTHDVIEGDGDEASPGSTVTAHYVGWSWSTGEQFDASWDRGEEITSTLGRVIAGWQQGIPGMRVGGRRLLVIPPELAYGDQPPPGSGIASGETLVFVVDLVGVD